MKLTCWRVRQLDAPKRVKVNLPIRSKPKNASRNMHLTSNLSLEDDNANLMLFTSWCYIDMGRRLSGRNETVFEAFNKELEKNNLYDLLRPQSLWK